ncbi:MAG: DUF2946 domain-containing protein [Pseudomonadota bacterium]
MSPSLHFALLRRPLAVWLAVLLVVFGALAPTLSHALVLARSDVSPMMMDVCTSTGLHEVADTASTDSPDGQEAVVSLAHCPFCLLSSDRVAPAPHPLLHLFAVLGEPEAPTVRQAFFYATPFALAPPPRGPPL